MESIHKVRLAHRDGKGIREIARKLNLRFKKSQQQLLKIKGEQSSLPTHSSRSL